jgi:predicted membrane-bound spermidine synthase
MVVSGGCALVYQTTWMRLFRLLFGATTSATGATLALFMGGMGLGGWLLGGRVERHPRPLALYGRLEIAIAALAVLSLGLLPAASAVYGATGGAQSLGVVGASAVRILLAAVVMGPATLLMGATLPAAARAITAPADTQRTAVAVLIGANTLGAVVGGLLTTFLLTELAGTRGTVLMTALLNAVIGFAAIRMDRAWSEATGGKTDQADDISVADERPTPLPLAMSAAGFSGFAFMLMELVWYRMLSPVLGGSSYTFGVVLATALLGLGLGGGVYAWVGRHRPASLAMLALTGAAEALFLVVPMALGDRVALFSAFLRSMGAVGFPWLVAGWSLVALVVVFPAAILAGIQFPLIIALAGRGGARVGREVGLVYAANTLGSIIGSLAGGFGLLPWLGAVGAWRLAGGLLVVLSLAAAARSLSRREERHALLFFSALLMMAASAGLLASGPTAVWRHSAIGAGRAPIASLHGRNEVSEFERASRRGLVREFDGVESAIGLSNTNGLSILVNGKSDGNTFADAGTTLMLGLLGPVLLETPRSALVIGLGTGMTAGWVAKVPSLERVDVAELEPAVVEVARAAHEVNEEVLDNPKVRLHHADGREFLRTSKSRYDLLVSEPSNPYRAGVADLYSQEFFAAARDHLTDDGMLVQWLQGYEVDARTLEAVLATIGSVFPYVDVWQTTDKDLLVRALNRVPVQEANRVRGRLHADPLATGVRYAWSTDTLEGVLAHFVADDAVVRRVLALPSTMVATDDRNGVEFGFARSVGMANWNTMGGLRDTAIRMGADRPSWIRGDVDWALVGRLRIGVGLNERVDALAPESQALGRRIIAPNGGAALAAEWQRAPFEPAGLHERLLLARALAEAGLPAALDVMNAIQGQYPAEAQVIQARLHLAQGFGGEAARSMLAAVESWRRQRWLAPEVRLPETALLLVRSLDGAPLDVAQQLFEAFAKPLPASAEEQFRGEIRLQLAERLGPEACREAFGLFEPHTPWLGPFLERRLACYEAAGDPRASTARHELEEFRAGESTFSFGTDPPAAPAAANGG